MENYQLLDQIMLILAILIVGGGLFMLFQGISAMNKNNQK
jgi:hypothetical protein